MFKIIKNIYNNYKMTSYTDFEISTHFNKCKDILDKVKLKWIKNNNEI